jgi:predicted phosphodiesterase
VFRFGDSPNVHGIACTAVLALLYDIHGNLPALEAVLADAKDADAFVLGGDYATAGAWPKETVERLKQLENATWIRGNADRCSWTATMHRRRSTRSRRAPLRRSATSWWRS